MKVKRSLSRIIIYSAASLIFLSSEFSLAQQSCANLFTTESNNESAKYNQAVLAHFENSARALYATSGFKNDREIIEAASKEPGRMGHLYREALDILGHEKVLVGMRHPVKIRAKVASNGFLNSHESGNSQGSTMGRDNIEASYSNMTAEEWKTLPNEVKPKYAALYPKSDSELLPPESLNSYTGSDTYYFKLDRIRDRMTMTPGDSLNRFKYWVGWGFEAKTPESWD